MNETMVPAFRNFRIKGSQLDAFLPIDRSVLLP